MACSCKKNQNPEQPVKQTVADNWKYQPQKEERIKPTDQCIACAQKHFCEAYCQLTEFGYLDENRTLAQGNLRQIVLHTFKDWKEIAKLARETALLVQSVEDEKALEKMRILGGMIDAEFYKANPEALQRLNTLKERANEQHTTALPTSGDGKPD